jgi:methionine sulfoxide reductase heme-binding subunit
VHLTSSPADWYAARAAGVVAYILLSTVVVLGVTMAGKKKLHRWPRFAVEDIHRFGGILVGTFVAIHVVTIAIDSWLPFSLVSIVVPFISKYKPIWVGLGIVAAELLVALAITNRLRNRSLPYRFWRRAHYLNFAVWGGATLHNLGSGTDRGTPWLLAIMAATIGLVVAAVIWRALGKRLPRAQLRGLAAAVSAAAVASAVVLTLGPLRFHPKPWNARTFRDTLTGQVQQQLGVTKGLVSFAGRGTGDQGVLVRADSLFGTKRLLSTSFQMEYLPSGLFCTGRVTHARNYGFKATCQTAAGSTRVVDAGWSPSNGADIIGGSLNVS